MKDFFSEMESDALDSDVESLNTEGLRTIAEIAKAVRHKEEELQNLELLVKKAKAELLKLTDEDLPNLILELGVRDFTLDDGSKVTIRTTYGAHIKPDNRDEAYAWLKQAGHDDIIKNIVSCRFGRGEDKEAMDFVQLAQSQDLEVDQQRKIEPMTLKGFVRERVEAGDEFPMELFGAYIGQRATIRGPKNG